MLYVRQSRRAGGREREPDELDARPGGPRDGGDAGQRGRDAVRVRTAYQFGYDTADQIRSATKQTTGGTPSVLARYQYAYDPAGNRTSEQIDDAVTGATYNNANQLVSTQPSGGMYFSGSVSEPSGVTVAGQPALVAPDNTFAKTVPLSAGTNTIAITATDPSGNAATKSYQVTKSGSTTSVTYDANGNLTSDGTRNLTWDAESRLVSVTIGTHMSTFAYDGLDRRVRIVESENGTTTSDTQFVWCGLLICEARNTSGTVLKRYFDNGVQDGGVAFFYTRDHSTSVRELLDSSGATRSRYDYDPFGRRTKVSGDQDTEFGFTGYFQHGSSDLSLATFRAYGSSIGRFLSEDPIAWDGGTNLYGYVSGNPASYTDPLGLFLFPWERPVTVWGGTPRQRAQVDAALARVFATARGQQLLEQIRGPWYWHGSPKILVINCHQSDQGQFGGSFLFIDPSWHPPIVTNTGPVPASLERVIGHELGHTLGTADDGPGRMNNINVNENPIARQLGQPSRIQY